MVVRLSKGVRGPGSSEHGSPFREEPVSRFDRRPGENWAMRWHRCFGVLPNPKIVHQIVQPGRRPCHGNAKKQQQLKRAREANR